MGVLRLSCGVRADYCMCVAAAAHKMAAGRRRGREELGDPRDGKGRGAGLPRSRVCSPRCLGALGRAPEPASGRSADAAARAEEREEPFGKAERPLPLGRRACRGRARPDSRGGGGEGAGGGRSHAPPPWRRRSLSRALWPATLCKKHAEKSVFAFGVGGVGVEENDATQRLLRACVPCASLCGYGSGENVTSVWGTDGS